MRTQIVTITLAGAALLGAAGCGSSPTGPSATNPPAATPTALRVSGGGGLEVDGSAQMRAEALYTDGETRDVTAQATWTSLSPDLATVEPGGRVRGVAFGTVTIQAVFGGQTATRALAVRGRRVNVTVTAIALDCVADCEDITQGDGDFAYLVQAVGTVGDSQTATTRTLSQTPSYPNASNVVRMGGGQSRALQNATTFEIREEAGAYVEVVFRAMEWDEFFGSSVADGRMNNDGATARFVWSTTTSWGSAPGTHQITLGASGCVLRLRYSLAVQPVG